MENFNLIEWLLANWMYVTIAVLLLDKIVALTPCKWDDMIWTSIKGVLRKLTGRTFLAMCMVLGLTMTLGACAGMNKLPVEDQAMVVSDKATDAYMTARTEYERLVDTLPPDKAAWLEDNVAVLLDEGRDYLVMLRESIAVWKRTKVKPDDVDTLSARITVLVVDVWNKINEILGKGHVEVALCS